MTAKRKRAILLAAISPKAFLAGMPPIPRSQVTWMKLRCQQMSEAMEKVENGRA